MSSPIDYDILFEGKEKDMDIIKCFKCNKGFGFSDKQGHILPVILCNKCNSQSEDMEYTIDDVLKILCAFTRRNMDVTNSETANITKTIYGSGLEFTINIKAKKAETKLI